MNHRDKPIVIYDGHCSFCMKWVERLRRWGGHETMQFMPLQDHAAPNVSGRTAEQLNHALHFVDVDGTVTVAAEAVRQALLHTKWAFPARVAGVVPGAMWISEKVYAKVASNRYIFGCNSETCSIDRK